MKRILVFADNFEIGGVRNVIEFIYDNLDKKNFKMDFVRKKANINSFDKKIIENGDNIFYYNEVYLNKIPIINYKIRQLKIAKQVIKQLKNIEKYDVIHIHSNPIIGLYIGIKLKIPIRIMHAHEAIPDFGKNVQKSVLMNLIWNYRKKKYNKWATIKAGDSTKACAAKFGENVINDRAFVVINPPVDMNKYNLNRYENYEPFSSNLFDKNKFNIINVGRMEEVKNQKFTIDIFSNIVKKMDAHLFFIGDGSLKNNLVEYVDQLSLKDKVSFLPSDTSPAIYKYMNCSLLTSFSEAFGMVAVESQLMGVPCFVSSTVPKDVDIGMCKFLDLSIGADEWVNAILSYEYKNAKINDKLKEKFATSNIMKKIENIYSKDK